MTRHPLLIRRTASVALWCAVACALLIAAAGGCASAGPNETPDQWTARNAADVRDSVSLTTTLALVAADKDAPAAAARADNLAADAIVYIDAVANVRTLADVLDFALARLAESGGPRQAAYANAIRSVARIVQRRLDRADATWSVDQRVRAGLVLARAAAEGVRDAAGVYRKP